MNDLDQAYAKLAAGEPHTPAPGHTRALLDRAGRAARSPSADERMGGLRVASAIGGRDAITVIAQFMKDADISVRRYAFNLGVAAKEDGLPVLREAVADPDPALAVDALKMLNAAVDKQSTPKARNLLKSATAAVRAAAADLLGNVAGLVVRKDLVPLEQDPDETVRNTASRAIARIDGKEPKRMASRWWEGPTATPAPARSREGVPPVRHEAPEESYGEPAAPPAAPAGGPGPADLLRKAGKIPAETTEAELRHAGEAALAVVLRNWKPGAEPDLGRGLAFAARTLKLTSWSTGLRRLLTDPDPSVRAAGVEALGVIATGAGLVPPISVMLTDTDPQVRAAAIRGLGALAKTLGRSDAIRPRLEPLAKDPDEGVRKTRDEVLAALA